MSWCFIKINEWLNMIAVIRQVRTWYYGPSICNVHHSCNTKEYIKSELVKMRNNRIIYNFLNLSRFHQYSTDVTRNARRRRAYLTFEETVRLWDCLCLSS